MLQYINQLFPISGVMFYAIVSELFSGQSPNSVYTEALKLCRNDQKLADLLGEPIKGYGELSSRGRRRHVRSASFILFFLNLQSSSF